MILKRFEKLSQITNSRIFYQVKQLPHESVIELLQKVGSCFDCQSLNEIKMVKTFNVPSDRISFGNTVKKIEEIEEQYHFFNVRRFVVDQKDEIDKFLKLGLTENVELIIRLNIDEVGKYQEWQLTEKFGCQPGEQIELQKYQTRNGLNVFGISFHVGSQNIKPDFSFGIQIYTQNQLMKKLERELGLKMKVLNIGGGFPQRYLTEVPSLEEYVAVINKHIRKNFGDNPEIEVMVEPGRGLVQDQGLLFTRVLLKKVTNGKTWIYLDSGIFQGLFESISNIRYRVEVLNKPKTEPKRYILQGPTCDSIDILGEYVLEYDIETDDVLVFYSTGQYTYSYNTVFNGFRPPILILV